MYCASKCVKSGTRSLTTSICGNGVIRTSPLQSSIAVVQARPFLPLIFIEQEPQIPSRHDRRKVREESCSLFILKRASSTIGRQLSRSRSEERRVGNGRGSKCKL